MKKHHKINGIDGLNLFELEHKDKPSVGRWRKAAPWIIFGVLYGLILIIAAGL